MHSCQRICGRLRCPKIDDKFSQPLWRLQHCQDAADFGTTAVCSRSVKPSKAAIVWFYDEPNRDASKIKVWWNFSPCLPHANCLTPCLQFVYLLLVFTYFTCGSFFTDFVNVFPRDLRSSGSAQMAWLPNLGRLQFRAKQSRESNATTIGNAKRTKLSWGPELSSPWLYHQSKAVAKKKCRKRSFFKIAFGCFWMLLGQIAWRCTGCLFGVFKTALNLMRLRMLNQCASQDVV